MQRDIDSVSKAWASVQMRPGHAPLQKAFRRALHNLFGACGAYSNDGLLQLCQSLQKVLQRPEPFSEEVGLINLHVEAINTVVGFCSPAADTLADKATPPSSKRAIKRKKARAV